MTVGYCRVSTVDQTLDKYIDQLISAGVDERNIYAEKVSGKRRDRPELNRMLSALKSGDIVVIPSLTRLGRSVKDLYEIVKQIEEKGAGVKSLSESWLDSTASNAMGKLLFAIFAGLAEFEVALISERTKQGLRAAKARGRYGGRPSKRNAKSLTVLTLYEKGIRIVDIVAQTELSRSTIYRILRDARLPCDTQFYEQTPTPT
ncbi:MAG: recombinase family protein [Defluviitaleaceae bacterium]|nr:recombinase family protein [Defluviitaleaceae bacterium]